MAHIFNQDFAGVIGGLDRTIDGPK